MGHTEKTHNISKFYTLFYPFKLLSDNKDIVAFPVLLNKVKSSFLWKIIQSCKILNTSVIISICNLK